jgi:hypothetical protein
MRRVRYQRRSRCPCCYCRTRHSLPADASLSRGAMRIMTVYGMVAMRRKSLVRTRACRVDVLFNSFVLWSDSGSILRRTALHCRSGLALAVVVVPRRAADATRQTEAVRTTLIGLSSDSSLPPALCNDVVIEMKRYAQGRAPTVPRTVVTWLVQNYDRPPPRSIQKSMSCGGIRYSRRGSASTILNT